MAFLDDAIRQLTQGGNGNGSQSLATALQELLKGNGTQPAGAKASAPPPAPAPVQQAAPQADMSNPEQEIFAGLNGLLKQLQDGGLNDAVKSWVGNGQNQPVHPNDLGQALGADKVGQMAEKAGCPQEDLLSQLSKALPGLIDQLTSKGRLPTMAELQQTLKNQ